jgi:hypothetical protein
VSDVVPWLQKHELMHPLTILTTAPPASRAQTEMSNDGRQEACGAYAPTSSTDAGVFPNI